MAFGGDVDVAFVRTKVSALASAIPQGGEASHAAGQVDVVDSSSDDDDCVLREALERRGYDGPPDFPARHAVQTDAVLECTRAIPQRARLQGRRRQLPADWVYIGRATSSAWACPSGLTRS